MASLQKLTLTIANGATTSDRIPLNTMRAVRAMSIQAPAALTGTVTVESGSDDDDAATFTAVQSPPGTDITCAAGKTTVLVEGPFPTLRLKSSLAEVGARTFNVWVTLGE